MIAKKLSLRLSDTPSHTGRKQVCDFQFKARPRYTLPYREETKSISAFLCRNPIHPPIQGGNTQCLCGFQPPQTPRCAICTNNILSLLICHFSGILADFYKKIFSHNNSKSLLIFPAISSTYSSSIENFLIPSELMQLSFV